MGNYRDIYGKSIEIMGNYGENMGIYGKIYLVGGAITILKNVSSSMGRIIFHIWKIKFMFETTN
jgi:hypothetical protein